jgi:multidrug efflux system membrane fusion protein
MSRNVISAAIVSALLLLWIGSGLFVTNAHSQSPAASDPAPFGVEPAGLSKVRVATMTSELRTRHVTLRGRTASKRVVEVKAEIAGKVISRPVERGQRVSQGQLLCELTVDDREVAVAEARAAFEQARIEHAGSLKLGREGLLSEVAIASSEARQEAARADLHRQELNLERTRITAPFDGVIEHLHLNAGDYATAGASCATLIDLNPMLVLAHVTETEVESLQLGSTVLGSTRTGREIRGQLSFIGKQSDPVTRTYPVEITVDNGDYGLRSGLTVNVRAVLDQVQAHLVASSLLTLGDNGAIGIRTLDAENRVEFTEINVIEDAPNGIWITGLPDTANLITVGHEYVTIGQLVEPTYRRDTTDRIASR